MGTGPCFVFFTSNPPVGTRTSSPATAPARFECPRSRDSSLNDRARIQRCFCDWITIRKREKTTKACDRG